jgi:hypothetical protein
MRRKKLIKQNFLSDHLDYINYIIKVISQTTAKVSDNKKVANVLVTRKFRFIEGMLDKAFSMEEQFDEVFFGYLDFNFVLD